MLIKKKGLSPIVAETLLIALVLVIILIIFLWFKSFVGEKITKDLGSGEEAIENACDKINFEVEARIEGGNLVLGILNKGNIPLYQIELKKKKSGSIRKLGEGKISFSSRSSLLGGQADRELNTGINTGDINTGETILVYPVIIGKTSKGLTSTYTCEKNNVEVKVG